METGELIVRIDEAERWVGIDQDIVEHPAA
jgi:hypothetical protein